MSDHPFKHIELEILTACDTNCFGCDRFSDVINSPSMTVEQVQLFVKESLELGWEWERIRLLGGEPTLHPKFKEMVECLIEYRKVYPKVFLQVLTNGLGKSKQYRPWLEENKISLHAEQKVQGVQPSWFNNTRITPVDRNPNVGELPPCGIFGVHGCGIGLTKYGYFLDGAGASVAKVAGFDIGKQSLKEVTMESMLEQAKPICRVCGHWNPTDGSPMVTELVTKTGQVTGEYYTKVLAAYKKEKPKMTVYGEQK